MGIWPYKFNSIDLLNFVLVFHLKWVIRNLFLSYLMVLMILSDLVILGMLISVILLTISLILMMGYM